MNETPDSIVLALSEDWLVMPTESDGVNVFIRTLREAMLTGDETFSTADRRRLDLLLEILRREMATAGLSLAAGLLGVPNGDRTDVTDGLLAFCTVTFTTRELLGSPLPITAEALLASLSLPDTDEASEFSRANVEPPYRFAMQSGDAIRRSSVVRYGSVALQLPLFEDTFYVATPDHEGLCVLQFVSPTVGVAGELAELFAEIAKTLQILYPNDPTPTETLLGRD